MRCPLKDNEFPVNRGVQAGAGSLPIKISLEEIPALCYPMVCEHSKNQCSINLHM